MSLLCFLNRLGSICPQCRVTKRGSSPGRILDMLVACHDYKSINEHDGSTTTAEADTNGSGLPDNDHSTGVLAMSEANMENAMKVKNRHAREEIQKKARQTLSKWGSRFNKNAAGGRTSLSTSGPEKKTPMPTVPAVVPQSTLMKKRLASHMETDGLNSESTPVSDMMGSQGRHARGESASETVAREYKQLSQDDIDIDYAQSCINAKHYSKAKDVVSLMPGYSSEKRFHLFSAV
ncbi:hypothetical protein EDD11_001481 [Mortierella claussenii]|nr:hypothetical protein EDD11_001481 [Mortierella claussenii]